MRDHVPQAPTAPPVHSRDDSSIHNARMKYLTLRMCRRGMCYAASHESSGMPNSRSYSISRSLDTSKVSSQATAHSPSSHRIRIKPHTADLVSANEIHSHHAFVGS
jgi:hypothetical protein